jgi:hypothetical protein
MTLASPTARGQLSIWTDIDTAHEADFNSWYDREHMQERMGIPGFLRARRFHAVTPCPRPYLALYDTESLQVFRQPTYQAALARQTDWSRLNFSRMRDTQRRVGELVVDAGQGEGAALALFVCAADSLQLSQIDSSMQELGGRDRVIRSSLLRTNVALSSPLLPGAAPVPADVVAMVEATEPTAAFDAASAMSKVLAPGRAGCVYLFRSLWRLGRGTGKCAG